MKWLMIFLVTSLAIAALQLALSVVLVVLVIIIVWGVYFRPAETFGLLAFFLSGAVLTKHPLPTILVIGIIATVALLVGSKTSPPRDTKPEQPLLPPPTTPHG